MHNVELFNFSCTGLCLMYRLYTMEFSFTDEQPGQNPNSGVLCMWEGRARRCHIYVATYML